VPSSDYEIVGPCSILVECRPRSMELPPVNLDRDHQIGVRKVDPAAA